MLSVDQNTGRDDDSPAGIISDDFASMTTSHLKQLSSPQTHVRFVFSLRLWNQSLGDRPWP